MRKAIVFLLLLSGCGATDDEIMREVERRHDRGRHTSEMRRPTLLRRSCNGSQAFNKNGGG